MDNEDFCRSVTVKRIGATRRLTSAADIKAGCLLDVDILVRILRDPATDDGEVLLASVPGLWVSIKAVRHGTSSENFTC
tara:strand:+ start:96 stop:332 length:237 start_codon:yes stop_codon:yes gene_type:complete